MHRLIKIILFSLGLASLIFPIPLRLMHAQAAALEPAPAYAKALPSVGLIIPASAFIGEDVNFSVTFDNLGTAADDTGYGPFVDVVIDTTGADAHLSGGPYDGLGTSSITAFFLDTAISGSNFFIIPFDAAGHALHPFVVDNTGNRIIVIAPPGFGEGDTLVVVRLPFGSFTPDQPAARIDFTVNMSDFADLGTALNVSARGGYEFGYTPLNDWCCGDAAYPSAVTGWTSDSVTPTLFTLSKTYIDPEDETASGPNFPHQYTINVNVAAGQTITNLDLTDILPSNLQFVSLDSTTVNGSDDSPTIISTPSSSTPGGTLTRQFGSVSVNAQMVFTYYIPRDNSVFARVIDPVTGNDVISCNNASTSGSWTPLDPRDSASAGTKTINPGGCEHTLTDKSIAIQKSVGVVGGGDPAPGKTLEYTFSFQVSDFFAFDSLSIEDVISDGQHFDTSISPQMTVNGNGFSLSAGNIAAGNVAIDCYYTGAVGSTADCDNAYPAVLPPPLVNLKYSGTTIMTFDVSSELIRRVSEIAAGLAHDHVLAGRLLGGCVPLAGSANPVCGTEDGTTVTITFQTVILNNFTDYFPSGDTSVDQGDSLNNNVQVNGNVLRTDTFASQGNLEDDDSAARVTLGRELLAKTIYAVTESDGVTLVCGPGAAVDPCPAAVLVEPGDKVTYRLAYVLPTSNVEDLTFTDYLPLPVFHVSDPDDNGVAGPAWTFSTAGGIPASGVVTLGPEDTFYSYIVSGLIGSTGNISANTRNPGATSAPVITLDSVNNMITVAYANYDDTRALSTKVDLLFTVTVAADPFADRLYLTNEAHGFEGDTFLGESQADAIVQIIVAEPVLLSNKGVVTTDNPNDTFSPTTVGPVTFNAPGTAGARWSGTITSPGLKAAPINSNVTGVDAGDLVTFAIVIENAGSSAKGAFDITILDNLPAQFQVPAGGLNLRIANGDNISSFTYHLPDGSVPSGDMDLFTTGIRIDDPDPSHGACQSSTVGPGKNIIIITYDLQLKPDVTPGTIVNTSQLTHYSGTDEGPNPDLPNPLEDTASATVAPLAAKTLFNTEIDNSLTPPVTNTKTQAVIGELATYQLIVTVPEGVTPAARIVDDLGSGMGFVSLDSFTNSAALSYAGSSTPVITGSGEFITFNLGDITNTDRINTTAETITIRYSVVVLNVSGNQANTILTNSAVYSWTGGSLPAVHAENITVIEPYLSTTKVVNGSSSFAGDAGDIVTFQVTLTNPTPTNPGGGSATDAYDINWADTILTDLTYQAGTLAFDICPATTKSLDESAAPALTASISDLAPGESCVLTFNARVDYTAEPGETITNTATTTWTSLTGDYTTASLVPPLVPRSAYNTNAVERTGSGTPALNDYTSQGSATVTINLVSPHKYLMNTSEPFTDVANGARRVAIGEIIRYRLVVYIPEGTSTNFQVRDNLADSVSTGFGHLTFIDDGTATVTFVSTDPSTDPTPPNNPILSDPVNSVPAIPSGCDIAGSSADNTTILTYTCALSDWNIGTSNSTTSDPDAFLTKPSDVYFKLGTLHNNDDDVDTEFVVIEFNALVDNAGSTAASSNDLSDRIANTFSVLVNNIQSDGNSTEDVDAYVAEAALRVIKTAVIDPSRDGGDTVVYTLTVSSSSGPQYATAFDLNMSDALDANLTPVSAVITSNTQGGACIGNGSGTTSFSDSVTLIGLNVTLTASCLDPGRNIVVTVTARVIDLVQVPITIPNLAIVTWTSLPGVYGTTTNPTGSALNALPAGYDMTSGGNEGERNGTQTPAQNDLRTTGSAPVTLASPAVDKQDASPLQYTIGQTVTYDIWVTLPEGVTRNLVVTDDIPSGTNAGGTFGMTYVSSAVITSGSGLVNPFAGTLPVPTNNCEPPGPCVTGTDLILNFGDVTNPVNVPTDDSSFIVRVTLRVDNVPGNQDGSSSPYPTSLVNSATITYTGATSPRSDIAAAITVIEARIATNKLVNGAASITNVKAGDTLTYTVRFTNSGHNTAFDVTADDILAQGVSYNSNATCVLNDSLGDTLYSGVTVTGTSTLHFDGTTAGDWDIPVGGYVECKYTAAVQTSMILNGSHTNTVDADWFSLNSGGGRSYNDGTIYNFDGTQDTTTATFSTALPTLAKSDGGFTAGTIGDSIHYTITVGGTDAIGTLRSLVITDSLPAGVIFDGNVIITGFSVTPAPGVSSPNDGSAAVTLTFTFGDTYKSIANATITFDVHLADVPGNVRTVVKTNSVSGSYRNLSNSIVNLGPATDAFTIVEPVITTTKTIESPIGFVQAGDFVTYRVRFTNTGDGSAYDVTADDILAQGVTYNDDAACVLNGVGTGVTVTGSTTLHFDGNPAGSWDLPPVTGYVECVYSVTVESSLFLDGIHTNTIDVDWSSQNGTFNGEHIYNDSPGDSINRPTVDGTQDTVEASFTTNGASISKSDGGVTQTVIGNSVHITLKITAPLGTLRAASVVDTLPAGLIYATGSKTVSSNITPGSGAAGFSVSVPNDGSQAVTLTWDFADAYVSSTPVVIQYDAIVANVTGTPPAGNNGDGTNLVNQVILNYTDAAGAPQLKTASDDFSIVEPVLSLTKTHSAFSVAPDAGDSVHYTVTIAPTGSSHATAYDVHFWDVLPADVSLDLTSHTVLVTLNGVIATYNTSASSETTNTVDVVINNIPTSATSVVIEYWATLKASVTPGELIANTGHVTWTSTSGTNSNERTGTGGPPNTYTNTGADSFNVHDPFFSKTLVTTSLGNDANSNLVIGETVTFGLNVTLPEGTTPSLHIFDDLPNGLEFVVGSASVVPSAGFIGTIPTPTVMPLAAPAGSGNDVTVDFGMLTVLPDANDANNTFIVQFQAVVMNEIGNQQPDTLTNNASMTVPVAGFPDWTGSDSVTIGLIEPVLTITKSATDHFPGPLQVLTFTLLTQQDAVNSNADAFDVTIFDDLPATLILDLNPASFQTTLSGGASGLLNNSHDNRVEFTISKIPLGGSVEIKFKVSVAASVVLNQTINNTATTEWTSMPGDLAVNPQERTAPGASPNDYVNSGSENLEIQKSINKTLTGDSLGATVLPEVAIGEILTYNVVFYVPEGLTTGVTLTDTLDLGLAFVDCVVITALPGIATTIPSGFGTVCSNPAVTPAYNPADQSAGGRQVVFNFGNLNNTSGVVGLITVQYHVVVLDVIENNRLSPDLNNSVRLDWSAGLLSSMSPTPVHIVEPDLLLIKTANINSALPGSEITFTLTIRHNVGVSSAVAYDVLLEDILPPSLDYVPGSLIYVSGIAPNSAIITPPAPTPPPALDDTAAPTLRVHWDVFDRFPVGEAVIQFKATLGNLSPGSSVTNTASIEWTSLPGNPGVQSVYNARSVERRFDPLSLIDIYGVSSSFTIGVPSLPATGFAPGIQTGLPQQPAGNSYLALNSLWLEIPTLDVEMPIVGVPIKDSGWDLTWLGNRAGYLEGTAYPTWPGTTGITGHVYLANGKPGPFINLHTMIWGQKIIFHMDGQQYVYEVREVRRVWPGDLSVLSHSDYPSLTLITCQGYNQAENDYLYRVAVRAVLVKILPESEVTIHK